MPKKTSDNVDEWDWVFNHSKYSTEEDEHLKSWYIDYSDSPILRWWLPNTTHAGVGATIYFGYTMDDNLNLNSRYYRRGSGIMSTKTYFDGNQAVETLKNFGSYGTWGPYGSWGYTPTGWKQYAGVLEIIWHPSAWLCYSTYEPRWNTGNLTYLSTGLARCIREDGTE